MIQQKNGRTGNQTNKDMNIRKVEGKRSAQQINE